MSRNNLKEWGKRLDAGETGDTTLELAEELRTQQNPAPSAPDEFKRQLGDRLVHQAEKEFHRPFLQTVFKLSLIAAVIAITIYGLSFLIPVNLPEPADEQNVVTVQNEDSNKATTSLTNEVAAEFPPITPGTLPTTIDMDCNGIPEYFRVTDSNRNNATTDIYYETITMTTQIDGQDYSWTLGEDQKILMASMAVISKCNYLLLTQTYSAPTSFTIYQWDGEEMVIVFQAPDGQWSEPISPIAMSLSEDIHNPFELVLYDERDNFRDCRLRWTTYTYQWNGERFELIDQTYIKSPSCGGG
jgi:uncharacterized protein (UPF0254 family)